MKYLCISFLLFTLLCSAQATDTEKLVCDNFYGVDDFENVYYSLDNTLYLKGKNKSLQYFDIQLGDIHYVDIINPLKILVFYQDSQTVVLLDNRLNEQLRIDLSILRPQRFIQEARLAGERRLWLFNADVSQLELYNYITNQLINSSPPIRNEVQGLKSDYNFCHIITRNEIISFNTYGSETSRLKVDDIQAYAFDFEQLLIQSKGAWSSYRFDREFRFRETCLPAGRANSNCLKELPQIDTESLYLKGGKLYICDGKVLRTYLINQNKE